jgi:CubicO group peptidase (beta-lactamase class C family)
VLAVRVGRSYEELIAERISRPLALADTMMEVPELARGRFAQGHNRRAQPVPHWDLPVLAGAGALRSTVADLLAFLRLQLGEGEPALVRAAALTQATRVRHRGIAVGLGWTRGPLLGTDHELLFHNGGTGGFRSFVGMVPATHTAVAVLSNSARSVDALGFHILEGINGWTSPSLSAASRAKEALRAATRRGQRQVHGCSSQASGRPIRLPGAGPAWSPSPVGLGDLRTSGSLVPEAARRRR